jgi:hypothetical protein
VSRLVKWKEILQQARYDYYYLNYLHPQQFHVLHSYYFDSSSTEAFSSVERILTFINPLFDIAAARAIVASEYILGGRAAEGEGLYSDGDTDDEAYSDGEIDPLEDTGSVSTEDSLDIYGNHRYKGYLSTIGAILDNIS